MSHPPAGWLVVTLPVRLGTTEVRVIMSRVTWKWIKESYFPLVMGEAHRAGLDVTGWALDEREGPGVSLVQLNPNKSVDKVFRRFTSPGDAELVLEGMRLAWSQVPDRQRAQS